MSRAYLLHTWLSFTNNCSCRYSDLSKCVYVGVHWENIKQLRECAFVYKMEKEEGEPVQGIWILS